MRSCLLIAVLMVSFNSEAAQTTKKVGGKPKLLQRLGSFFRGRGAVNGSAPALVEAKPAAAPRRSIFAGLFRSAPKLKASERALKSNVKEIANEPETLKLVEEMKVKAKAAGIPSYEMYAVGSLTNPQQIRRFTAHMLSNGSVSANNLDYAVNSTNPRVLQTAEGTWKAAFHESFAE